MRILLTGGSGFIGTHMAVYLKNKGVDVICLGRTACSIEGVKNIVFQSLSAALIENALKKDEIKIDAIIHLAAAGVHPDDRDNASLINVNERLPADMIKLGHKLGVRAVVLTGSSAEYKAASVNHLLAENDPLQEKQLYGSTKARGGCAALSCGIDLNMPVAWMRLFNVYGAGEAPHRLFPSLVSKLKQKMNVDMSEGTQIRDFVYVNDVCDALWAALNGLLSGMQSGAYNVCTGIAHSVKDFAIAVAQAMKADMELLRFGALSLRSDDAPHVVGDPSKFKVSSGWSSSWSLERGIYESIK